MTDDRDAADDDPSARASASNRGAARSRVVVALPCYNEAAAVGHVIDTWHVTMPEAEVVVFDNASTDGTGAIARGRRVRVIEVPRRGKGFVVRAMFETLRDADVVVLVDGDGTYPAESARDLIAPVLADRADMTVGARVPTAEAGSLTPVRKLGNLLIRGAFRILVGAPSGDLLSGYRAFNRTYRDTVTLRSEGFEIETELASEAVARGLRVVEIPVVYRPRIAGSTSKLRAFRDGARILAMIVSQSARRRPARLATAALVAASLSILALAAAASWLNIPLPSLAR